MTPAEYDGCKQIWLSTNAASTIRDKSIQYMVDPRCSQGGPGCIEGYCRRCTLVSGIHTDLVLCASILEAAVRDEVISGAEADDVDFDTQIKEEHDDFDEVLDDSDLSETPAEVVAAEGAEVSGSDGDGDGDEDSGDNPDDSSSGSGDNDHEEGEFSAFQQLSESDFDDAVAPLSGVTELIPEAGGVPAATESPLTEVLENSSLAASTPTMSTSVVAPAASTTSTSFTTSTTPASNVSTLIATTPTAVASVVTPVATTITTTNSTTVATTPSNATSTGATPAMPAGLVTTAVANTNATISAPAAAAAPGHTNLPTLNTTATTSITNPTTASTSASAVPSQSSSSPGPSPSSATPSVVTSASCQTSQGDRAVGISTVVDTRCGNGGLGCISGGCRQCRLIDTPKSAHLDACPL